jgi:hypothetical protein
LDSCDGKPVIIVDRGPWYRWALERLGITYFHETFGERNRIERWFREVKNRTKRFYNNINAKTLKCLEELVTAIAIVHNAIKAVGEEVILTCQHPLSDDNLSFHAKFVVWHRCWISNCAQKFVDPSFREEVYDLRLIIGL